MKVLTCNTSSPPVLTSCIVLLVLIPDVISPMVPVMDPDMI